jgi:hypothetical protein
MDFREPAGEDDAMAAFREVLDGQLKAVKLTREEANELGLHEHWKLVKDEPRHWTHPGHHWCFGWYFQRTEDGNVKICVHDERPPYELLVSALIPASQWASIVASVSLHGEGAESFHDAERLHRGVEGSA